MKTGKNSKKKRRKKTAGIIGLIFLGMVFLGSLGGGTKEAQNLEPGAALAQGVESLETGTDLAKEAENLGADSDLQTAPTDTGDIDQMQVHFIDVGQGDATLLTCGGEAMLIDAGDDSKGTALQNYLQKQGVTWLKYLVLTHTDADHIGGSDVIVSKFQVDNVFIGDFPKENRVYRDLMTALASQGYPWCTPEVGSTYTLGSAVITILAPVKEYSEPNNCSIALLVENGEDSFLFTGDAEKEAETDILKTGLLTGCDVFKAGHHGSKSSNSAAFLEAISPQAVVISCGEDNAYGHPHAGPLTIFRSMGVKVFRTDEQGTIVATSIGNQISWNAAPSETWQAGEPKGSSGAAGAETTATELAAMEKAASMPEAKSASTSETKAASVSETRAASTSETKAASIPEAEAASTQEKEEQSAVQPAPAAPQPSSGEMVWKSATGKKYHSIDHCGNMNPNKATQITREQAEAMGLGRCSNCY